MIRIENLSKRSGGRVHFDGASFKINSKERVGPVGRNGHGKTTLLKVLAGSLAPASGQVTFNPQVESGMFEQTNV